MANEMFTALPSTVSAQLTDIICAVQGYVSPSSPGTSVQETLGQIIALAQSNLILNYPGNPNGNVAGTTYGLCWDTTDKVMYVCTTSGNAATAVWTVAGSFSFPLALNLGGTGAALTAANGAIPYSTATAMAFLAPTATGGQMFQSGANSAPSWSTAVYSSTYAASTLLYSNGANTVQGLPTANSAMLFTNSLGVPAWSASMTNGQLMIGSTGASPAPATLTAGTNITITNTAAGITISASGAGGFSWNHVTGTSANMLSNNGYVPDNVGLVTLTLPLTSILGDEIEVIGKGAGGWKIAQNTGQQIVFGTSSTTSGTGGSLASSNANDSVYLVCTVANTTWTVGSGPQGNLTVV